MLRRVVTLRFTDVAEERTASITRAIIHFIALIMEAVRTSETSFNFNVTTRHNIQQDSKLVLYTLYFNVLIKVTNFPQRFKNCTRRISCYRILIGNAV
jgi:hypothetical protein